ncbi:MAG: NAD-dependent epimerase [Candidatus Kapabacteria bacterium]|nr:NAD-dependent epimerase [Candidatus Kapabacteria bacterium]
MHAPTPTVLITGMAGFIGFHLARRLVRQGARVVGLDNLNDYYDPSLKHARLAELGSSVTFYRADLADKSAVDAVFAAHDFDVVIHLAAQAGVRYSIENPEAYIQSNLVGTFTILEACRHKPPTHLIYASSSSVYGNSDDVPFRTDAAADAPVSLYAATKRSNELMAYCYSHLYGVPSTGLRFFTVYGPWGRPDMAYFSFTRDILAGRPITVYNDGEMSRDFTYVDDIVEGIVRLIDKPPVEQKGARHRILNIGNNSPVNLMDFVRVLERTLGTPAVITHAPMQPGDVVSTWADSSELWELTGFTPSTSVEAGVMAFAEWYRTYYPGPRSE